MCKQQIKTHYETRKSNKLHSKMHKKKKKKIQTSTFQHGNVHRFSQTHVSNQNFPLIVIKIFKSDFANKSPIKFTH